jgi:hypothetical protein
LHLSFPSLSTRNTDVAGSQSEHCAEGPPNSADSTYCTDEDDNAVNEIINAAAYVGKLVASLDDDAIFSSFKKLVTTYSMPFLFNICYLKFLISFVLFINHLF